MLYDLYKVTTSAIVMNCCYEFNTIAMKLALGNKSAECACSWLAEADC